MRYVTTEQVSVPAGTVIELTAEQAKKLGKSVKPASSLRNDLGVEVPPELKVLPQEKEEE